MYSSCLIIIEIGDVWRHRALCEYGAIKMLYFIIYLRLDVDQNVLKLQMLRLL